MAKPTPKTTSRSMDSAVDAAAVEIAQSGAHSLVLTEDGRVLSFGDNESGQGNTGGWKLWP